MKTALNFSTTEKETLLAALARQGLLKQKLASADGSGIYAVSEGWQIAYLKDSGQVAEAQDSDSFQAAAQDANISTIFVPKSAAMTLEIVQRILERSAQPKTVFWEV